ncbi:MAG: glucose-1-phosphate adenylyltransferase [Thermoguttaceae bacterium]|nr:glucose-1-phosphate adenylyltransferase [Planctomycetaceae bacterium]MBQ4143281.1 glucose-1-phosphate adenylyltransferase [Thermoguttaceae bacterium]
MTSALTENTMAIILAGGKGSRLEPLTRDRAKPAVPFGGAYRIIDFTLSNVLNSGIRKVLMLTQYKTMSLDRHVNLGWQRYFQRELGQFIDIVPPQQRIDENWYQGTGDAVYQNIYTIERERPKYVVILAGDHIYKMDYRRLLQTHIENHADLTISTLRVPTSTAARRFGVLEVDEANRVIGFAEKPVIPKEIPNQPDYCLASMGIYVFNTEFLFEKLCQDALDENSRHDFGGDIIPSVIDQYTVYAHPFNDENRKSESYWRDVGTLDAFFDANMDLIDADPQLNLYDRHWPIWTCQPNCPPPKFVFAHDERIGMATDSLICNGSIISGAFVNRSVLGFRCRVNSYAQVEESILFSDVEIGRKARISRAILDSGVKIEPGMEIGFDPELDRARGFYVTENGITIVTRQCCCS